MQTSTHEDSVESSYETSDVPPADADATGSSGEAQVEEVDTAAAESIEMLGKLPPEMGTLLLVIGIVGVILPGPVGTPLLIAGGLVLWPKTFSGLEAWFSKKFPAPHREGVLQIKRFVSDLQTRFPD